MQNRRGKSRGKKKSKKKVVLAGLASDFPLTDKEISAIRQTYDIFARTGRLEGGKIGTVLRLIGGVPTEEELQNFGVQPQETVTFQEFLKLVEKHRANHGFMAEELREAFKIFDSNGDGDIDASELISILTQVSLAYLQINLQKLIFLISPI